MGRKSIWPTPGPQGTPKRWRGRTSRVLFPDRLRCNSGWGAHEMALTPPTLQLWVRHVNRAIPSCPAAQSQGWMVGKAGHSCAGLMAAT